MDLAVEYRGLWNIIEVKLLRQGKSFEALMEEGIQQTLGYRERFSRLSGVAARLRENPPTKCYLIIFDRRTEKAAWTERLKWIAGDDVTVVGC
jgi:hypothetical protein